MRGEPIGAIDLSGVRDLTALALLWPGEIKHIAVEFWTPKVGLEDRAKRDNVPWARWVDEGLIIATPGETVDYRWVAVRLGELQSLYGLRRVAFDPWRIKYLRAALDEEGVEIEFVAHGQGFYRAKDSGLWMPRSIEVFEELLTNRKVKVLKNPALTFCAASAVIETDAKENRVYTKRRSKGRIDGIVAATMAAGLDADVPTQEIPSDYVPAFI